MVRIKLHKIDYNEIKNSLIFLNQPLFYYSLIFSLFSIFIEKEREKKGGMGASPKPGEIVRGSIFMTFSYSFFLVSDFWSMADDNDCLS